MTVVMSKLKQLGDHYNIPHNYVTRSVSCAIFALYFYKIGGPILKQCLGEIQKKARKAQDNITGCDGNVEKDPVDGFITGISSQDVAQKKTKNESYVNFGPRDGGYQDFIVDTLVSVLTTFQRVTGIDTSFIVQLVKIIRIMVPGVRTIEVGLLILHTLSLVSRTFLSVRPRLTTGSN